MKILIGVDEAGYGPQLGPLVVAATAWRVDAPQTVKRRTRKADSGARGAATATAERAAISRGVGQDVDLYKLLRKAVVRSPGKRGRRVAIADSKALYKSGLGLGQLERGVLAALVVARGSGTLPANTMVRSAVVRTAVELIAATRADDGERRRGGAWHFDDELGLPIDAEAEDLQLAAELLDEACRASGVALAAVRARLVFADEFNELVERFGNKSSALSHVTLELVRALVDSLEEKHGAAADAESASVVIYLDKHGGRNRYAALVQHHFAECWIEPITEGRSESRYRWEHCGRRVEAVFRMGCEALLPTALASMTAKYHREVAMRAFNAYWAARVPGLRPTAGYYGDSRRFLREIGPMQTELGIEDRVLCRCR